MAMGTWITKPRRVAQQRESSSNRLPKRAPDNGWIVEQCWVAIIVALSLLFSMNIPVLGIVRYIVGLTLLASLLSATIFGVRLIKDRSPWAMLWWMGVVTTLLTSLVVAAYAQIDAIWLLFPLSAVTSVVHFSQKAAKLHALLLIGTFLLTRILVVGTSNLVEECVLATFVFILTYLVLKSRSRESQLMEEVATWAAEADAFTTITGTMTSLQPTDADIARILTRACPPNTSLALMRWDAATATLRTQAAVGAEAEALTRWSYVVRADSNSIVAQAMRQRQTTAAALGGDNAILLLFGALPSVFSPVRSAAALPIMRQDAEPFGVLLAIATETEAVGQVTKLGMLPAIANQFAIALENAQLFEQAQGRADHDAMTGLYHHRALHMRLNEEVSRASRRSGSFAILMLDLDRFKLYNETYGHQVGDRIICQAAEALRLALRPSDILGRYGGDEFLAILPETDLAEARQLAQTLIKSIAAETFRPRESDERMPLTLSVGLAVFPCNGQNALELVACAEQMMVEAKHNGGNRCEAPLSETPAEQNGRTIDLRSFGVLEALVTAVDHKDRYTKDHSDEVATYAQLLAEAMALPSDRRAVLFDAGLLHDVGKVGVPDAVLRKPGRLTNDEFDAMKQHVVLSEALLRCLLPPETDPDVLDAVRCHHERWDGHGYPRGLAGEAVPLVGRIMIVADAVSAMHMDRPYRKGLSTSQIIAELRRGAGTQFDPELVEPFIAAFLAHQGLTEADLELPHAAAA